jgi:hypothetical protein
LSHRQYVFLCRRQTKLDLAFLVERIIEADRNWLRSPPGTKPVRDRCRAVAAYRPWRISSAEPASWLPLTRLLRTGRYPRHGHDLRAAR